MFISHPQGKQSYTLAPDQTPRRRRGSPAPAEHREQRLVLSVVMLQTERETHLWFDDASVGSGGHVAFVFLPWP